ncbi:MAG: divergent polysaccharide deacetylase family protein [Nitrospirae bacterium]|nr:divergent polysaccharide deacetylase family protein [Nitrospirota bacterium]
MPKNKRKSKKRSYIVLIFLLIIAGAFFFHEELGKEGTKGKPPAVINPKKENIPSGKIKRPKVAIVIDDMGENKKAALELLDINVRFACAIIPHETHTEWVAGECSRLGHEVIAHIPMEAKSPHKLGKGGLYTWMTEAEIIDNINDDIKAVPHAAGISNHMGSAFTEDSRAMRAVMTVLKKRGLFFLDSLTTSGSFGNKLAKTAGVKSLRRDVFLDDENSPAYIRAQWETFLKIARKRGTAIALGHPKENTIKFLKEVLQKNEVEVVPLSELIK